MGDHPRAVPGARRARAARRDAALRPLRAPADRARSTTEVVDGLEERGLVERSADPSDRRATLVATTEEGRSVGAAIMRARRTEGDKMFGVLSADDQAELARILGLLRK